MLLVEKGNLFSDIALISVILTLLTHFCLVIYSYDLFFQITCQEVLHSQNPTV